MEEGTRNMPRVLLIDDDPALMRLMKFTLREEGFNVAQAANGAEGLQGVDSHRPQAIVLDMQMPVMDGAAFYQELRSRGDETPVLIISANDARASQRALNADAFLQKPFDPDALVGALRGMIESAA